MPAAPVVANNTPLVALWTIGQLDLLQHQFDEILIPQAVRDEFLAVERTRREATLEGDYQGSLGWRGGV